MKSSLRRIAAVAVAAVTTLGIVTGCSSSEDDTQHKLVLGYSTVFGFLNLAAAQNLQPEGVEVEYKKFTNFNDMLAALNSGNLDLTEIGDVGAVSSFANGGDIRVVASTESNARATGFIVGPDSTARSFADLKGQRISFNKATNAYPNFLGAIAAEGLTESDFEVVQLPSEEGYTALINGDVGAKEGIEPTESNFLLTHGGRELVSGEGFIQNYYPYVSPTSTVEKKSDALSAFLKGLRGVITWAAANPAEHAALVAPTLGVSEQAVIEGYSRGAKDLTPLDARYQANVQKVVDVFLQVGQLKKQPDLDTLLDGRFNDVIFGSK